jgi:hypothetical protein
MPLFLRLRTLKKLNKQFCVPTVRKPPPDPIVTTVVSEYMASNLTSRNGPATIQRKIMHKDGIFIPR